MDQIISILCTKQVAMQDFSVKPSVTSIKMRLVAQSVKNGCPQDWFLWYTTRQMRLNLIREEGDNPVYKWVRVRRSTALKRTKVKKRFKAIRCIGRHQCIIVNVRSGQSKQCADTLIHCVLIALIKVGVLILIFGFQAEQNLSEFASLLDECWYAQIRERLIM